MSRVEDIPKSYEDAVLALARWHAQEQDFPVEIFSYDDPKQEVVRLVEISDTFPETGEVWAVPFGRSDEFPFRSAVVLATQTEWQKIKDGKLSLPEDWNGDQKRRVWPAA